MQFISFFHPIVWIILNGTIFTRIASFMTIPFLAIYLQNQLHASPLMIGITLGIAQLCATVGGFIGGYLTDKFGRKFIILTTVFIWSAVFVGFATVGVVELFILLNAINGLCRSFFEPATQALMIDFTEEKKRRRLFSFRYTAINIAAVIGPLCGVWISGMSNAKIPFFITATMYAVYGVFLIFMFQKYDVTPQNQAQKQTILQMFKVIFSDKKLLYLLAGGILVNLCYSQFDSTLPQYINLNIENGVKLYSVLITLNAIVVLALQLPIGIYTERISIMKSLVFGILFFAAGFIIFNFAHTPWLFIVGMIIFTVGEIFAFPMMNALIEEIAPATQKATYLGASQFKNLGGFIGPVFGGWLLIHFSSELYIVMAVIFLFSLVFYRLAFLMKETV
ncbi:MDR family MFS transporter [Neobacillus massiliamazoniensis]|uniref:Putative efflux transporter n=1 Tax=Neobacillus massiliamazoniensis TaxID=1499688 RepID=A0A0U1P2K3_9BACI|nr:MFS transporter [Neobacillus massiliamazoniensis]CRK84544.1 putative efflux transporter [Neobacillus massiliamazoniensis]